MIVNCHKFKAILTSLRKEKLFCVGMLTGNIFFHIKKRTSFHILISSNHPILLAKICELGNHSSIFASESKKKSCLIEDDSYNSIYIQKAYYYVFRIIKAEFTLIYILIVYVLSVNEVIYNWPYLYIKT